MHTRDARLYFTYTIATYIFVNTLSALPYMEYSREGK